MDMGTDSLTAVGLGVEQPDPQGMRLPPRLQNERLLTLPLALRAYLFLGVPRLQVRGPWRCGGYAVAPDDPL